MKLAISNIAWPLENESEAAELMLKYGFGGVEIAPTKMWPSPQDATNEQIDAYRKEWNDRGLEVVATQALLYGRPDLTIFDDNETRTNTLNYLAMIIRLSARLGAKALVFGSPKNRLRKDMALPDALSIAQKFFSSLGDIAVEHGVRIVIEANPTQYGADFLTKAEESTRFVADLNHPGIGLHLCSGCMMLAEDPLTESIRTGASHLTHFHISAPFLESVAGDEQSHRKISSALKAIDFDGWASIEMKTIEPFSMTNVEEVLALTRDRYT